MAAPLLLAGPILRRVEARSVTVWAAFREHQLLSLQLWNGDKIKHSGGDGLFHSTAEIVTSTSESRTIRAGQNLWISVVTAKLDGPADLPLQSGEIYSYNLQFEDAETGSKGDLRTQGLLSDAKFEDRPQLAIGYKKDVLPTFILPAATPDKILLAQGSCRKMHGLGDEALNFLDKIIEDNHEEGIDGPKPDRIQQLFLTGDQIYADDVPALGLQNLNTIDGLSLVTPTTDEPLRIRKADGSVESFEAGVVNFPPFLRAHVLQTRAGFTSTDAANHLMSFEEYCGAYLKYWSIRNWNLSFLQKLEAFEKADTPEKRKAVLDHLLTGTDPGDETNFLHLAQDPDHLRPANLNDLLFTTEQKTALAEAPDGEHLKALLDDWRESLSHELTALVNFKNTLPKVSRVLANVPTYMIFDDHEITDDWNITHRTRNLMLSQPLGRDIIRNGLMAYAIFQDWGNVPAEYRTGSTTPRARFLGLIEEYASRVINDNMGSLEAQVIQPMEALLGLDGNPPGITWHYQVPTGVATTLVLDTRNRREYPSLNAPPGLLDADALHEQLPDTLPGNPPFVIVVSPAPALGLASFEELFQPGITIKTALLGKFPNAEGVVAGRLDYDFEAWGFNIKIFERFLAQLAKYKTVVLLSGDVHFGFSTVMDYWKTGAAAPARFIQLTSTALKNEWKPDDILTVLKSGLAQRVLTAFNARLEKVGWLDKILETTGEVTPRNRIRLRQATAVVPVAGWSPGATVNLPPDWRWRLRVVGDERPLTDDEVLADIPDPEQPTFDADAAKTAYFQIPQRHQTGFIARVNRRLVWTSHVTLVRFTGAGGTATAVKHEFIYGKKARDKTTKLVTSGKAGVNTIHEIALAPSAAVTLFPDNTPETTPPQFPPVAV